MIVLSSLRFHLIRGAAGDRWFLAIPSTETWRSSYAEIGEAAETDGAGRVAYDKK